MMWPFRSKAMPEPPEEKPVELPWQEERWREAQASWGREMDLLKATIRELTIDQNAAIDRAAYLDGELRAAREDRAYVLDDVRTTVLPPDLDAKMLSLSNEVLQLRSELRHFGSRFSKRQEAA